MQNCYQEFDALIAENKATLKYFENNFSTIKKQVENCKTHEIYSTKADGLGILSPSLITDRICKGYRKGKRLKNKPMAKDYCIYELDSNHKPLCICHVGDVSFYFIAHNNATFALPCINDERYNFYPTYSHKIEYKNDKLYKYSQIDSNSLWQEVYEFKNENLAVCYRYYYVPNLAGSNKAIPLGEKGSPAKAFRLELSLNRDKVIKILMYEFPRNKLVYTWEK